MGMLRWDLEVFEFTPIYIHYIIIIILILFFYNIFLDKLFNVVIKLNKFTHQNIKVSLI
jgi:hypothetical protein